MAELQQVKAEYGSLSTEQQREFLDTIPYPKSDSGLTAIWITLIVVLGAALIALIIVAFNLGNDGKDAAAAWTAVGTIGGGLLGFGGAKASDKTGK